jgi:hypothetical protein
MNYILQCPKCSFYFEWICENGPPGKCQCNPREPWKVIKEKPKNKKDLLSYIALWANKIFMVQILKKTQMLG